MFFNNKRVKLPLLVLAITISSATFASDHCWQFYIGFGSTSEVPIASSPQISSDHAYHTFEVGHRSGTENRPRITSLHEVFMRLQNSDPALAQLASHTSFQFVEIPLSRTPVTLGHEDEIQRQVTLTRPISMMATAVTQRLFASIMGSNPSRFKKNVQMITVNGNTVQIDGDERPVDSVTHDEAVEFAERLSRLTGRRYRLPTEAEWEVAARAGTTTRFSHGSDPSVLGQYAQFDGDSGTHPVAQLKPNGNGLYDMHGNVLEWVSDWYSESPGGGTDPTGPRSGSYRVLRGGGWSSSARYLRSAARGSVSPGYRGGNVGFRLVEELP